jgi:O-acetyl-ADP-ribose deacetylase (regulator of RNase III)
MIQKSSGNILEADAEALVNTVNCVGVMGRGVALQFKRAYPENFRAYEQACAANDVRPGRMFIFATGRMVNPRYVINFPTKRHWKAKSRIADIDVGLQALVAEVTRLGIKSIALPPLGCGNGGLDWAEVEPKIKDAFAASPEVTVLLYAPQRAPRVESMPIAIRTPEKMTRSRALFVKLIERYRLPGYRLSLLEIQKLAYFLQAAGEPLRLQFVKHKYGPYAENLNHVLQRIEGHFICGYGDRSQGAQIELLPKAAALADSVLADDPAAVARVDRVGKLIEGFETPYGMELLATAHWVGQHEIDPSNDQAVITAVQGWSQRKRERFTSDHICKAVKRLRDEQWLPVSK